MSCAQARYTPQCIPARKQWYHWGPDCPYLPAVLPSFLPSFLPPFLPRLHTISPYRPVWIMREHMRLGCGGTETHPRPVCLSQSHSRPSSLAQVPWMPVSMYFIPCFCHCICIFQVLFECVGARSVASMVTHSRSTCASCACMHACMHTHIP